MKTREQQSTTLWRCARQQEIEADLHLEDAAEVVVGDAEALGLRLCSHGRHQGHAAAGGGHRGGPRQLQLDAHRVAVDGLVRAAGLAQRIAQIVVGLGEVWLMHKRLTVCRYCLVQLALLVVHPCTCGKRCQYM